MNSGEAILQVIAAADAAGIAYMLIQKVRWGRQKDRSDALDVMSVQAGHLDWPYIESWCDRHNTRTLLEELRAAVPPI